MTRVNLLFNFKTLDVYVNSETKSMTVYLNREEQDNAINVDMIFELERFLSWLSEHVEVHAVLFTSRTQTFSTGLDQKEFSKMEDWRMKEIMMKLQKLIYSMFFLPQTIIFDLKESAHGVAAELSIGGDIRLARAGCKISFNHLSDGMIPSCGGIGFLGAFIPKSFVRSWLFGHGAIRQESLVNSGFLTKLYRGDEYNSATRWLTKLSKCSPVSRIQLKRSLLEPLLPQLESALNFETKFFEAALKTGDWKAVFNSEDGEEVPFTNAKTIRDQLAQENQRSA